ATVLPPAPPPHPPSRWSAPAPPADAPPPPGLGDPLAQAVRLVGVVACPPLAGGLPLRGSLHRGVRLLCAQLVPPPAATTSVGTDGPCRPGSMLMRYSLYWSRPVPSEPT